MKKNLSIIILYFLCGFVNTSLAGQLKEWGIISNSQEFMLTAKGDFSNYKSPIKLALDDSIDISSPLNLLSKYYWLLINNKLNDVSELYADEDGSRRKFLDAIGSKKLRLEKYSQLNEVYILDQQKWDQLTFVTVKLVAKNGRKLTWNETIFCDKKCHLIYSPLQLDAASDLMGTAKMTFLESNRISGDLTGRISFPPNTINITANHPKVDLLEGKRYPLEFSLNIKKYDKGEVVERKESCEDYRLKEAAGFCRFLKEMAMIDSQDESALREYFIKSTGRSDLYGVNVNINGDDGVNKIFYSAQAFVGFVKKWNQVNLIGYLENDSTRFVLFQPITSAEEIIPFQMVTFKLQDEKIDGGLVYGSNWEDAYLLFYNNIFSNALNSQIKSW